MPRQNQSAEGVPPSISPGGRGRDSPTLTPCPPGYREFANRTSGMGEVHRIPEVSIVAKPHIAEARWMST